MAKAARCLTRTRRRALYHAEAYPALGARGDAIPDVAEVDGALRGLFDPMGAIRDDASPELQEACQRRAALLQRLKVRLDKYLLREDVADLPAHANAWLACDQNRPLTDKGREQAGAALSTFMPDYDVCFGVA